MLKIKMLALQVTMFATERLPLPASLFSRAFNAYEDLAMDAEAQRQDEVESIVRF